MENKIINQHDAIKLIEAGEDISAYQVVFNQEKIEALQAILLGKNKIDVPSELIFYDDDAIDFTDDPDITEKDFETGELIWNIKTSLPIDKDIKDWITKEKIDVDKLLSKLMRNFYETVKDFPKKAAF
ncbi:MAG: hypothetical protein Q8R96_20520 [Bacteroidota bacterium]|nr:hypothetical protein [Bacteroidota bacterium]